MDNRTVDQMLRTTLEDRRMTRSERSALTASLAELISSRRDVEQIRARAFALAGEHMGGREATAVLHWLNEVVKLLETTRPSARELRCEAVFSPGEACTRRVLELLRATTHWLEVCVFTITDDRISRALLDCHRRGVRVRVITDDAKAWEAGSDIAALVDGGIEVANDQSPAHMHHKFALFDRGVVATGSYNWTRSAATENQENLVVCDHPPLVCQFGDEFDRLWKRYKMN